VSWTHSIDSQLKWKNAEWCTQTLRGRKLYVSVRMLWKSCTSCSSAEVDLCMTILCQMVQQSMANNSAHSCRIRWGQLFTINNQYCLALCHFAPAQCNTSVSRCAKSAPTSGLGCVGTCSLLSRFRPMLLLVGCMCEWSSLG
jgi:hypothetical protein